MKKILIAMMLMAGVYAIAQDAAPEATPEKPAVEKAEGKGCCAKKGDKAERKGKRCGKKGDKAEGKGCCGDKAEGKGCGKKGEGKGCCKKGDKTPPPAKDAE